uniref:Uncharacterized protein n=1 Tax=Arundo donax TaxID=35708 RepID=A0A0A9C7E8_ARUDO
MVVGSVRGGVDAALKPADRQYWRGRAACALGDLGCVADIKGVGGSRRPGFMFDSGGEELMPVAVGSSAASGVWGRWRHEGDQERRGTWRPAGGAAHVGHGSNSAIARIKKPWMAAGSRTGEEGSAGEGHREGGVGGPRCVDQEEADADQSARSRWACVG